MATRAALLVALVACSRSEAPQPAAGSATPAAAADPHGFLAHAASPQPLPTAPPAAVLAAPPTAAQRTASGLYSDVLRASADAEQPRRQDAVVMKLDAWDSSGRLVESYTPNDAFMLSDGMPGMIEGILQMRRGERRRMWISERLQGAYRLAPGTIVADVELVDIVRQ